MTRHSKVKTTLVTQHLPACLIYFKLYHDYRPNTIRAIKSRLQVINRWFQKEKVGLNKESFEKYILYLKEKNADCRYIEGHIEATRRFCDYLVIKKILNYNWAKEIPIPKRLNKIPNILSIEEIAAILNTPRSYRFKPHKQRLVYDAVLGLLAKTGCRVGEAVDLRIEDLDLIKYTYKIRDSKTRSQRIVPLPPELIPLLRELVKDRLPTDYVFIGVLSRGRLSIRLVQMELKARAEKANITKRVYPHLLRHSFITELLAQDISILKVQRIVGHKKLETTMLYTHLLYEDLKEAVLRHPLVRTHRNPHEILEHLKTTIKGFHLDEDKRFLYELTEGNGKIKVNIFIR